MSNPDVDNVSTEKAAPITEYVLLSRDNSGFWTQYEKNVKAYSAELAIKSLKAEGTYVAIPHRSWKPLKVQAEQQTILKLNPA